ncbi:DUF3386 domain-containing protein [Synechococcus sp. M16CYN]|uniref:DUF3386 domain-containing protein n=1 Tax=Synechococcus sp. M16CYN TaxID=3103139 RepID=UPI00324C29E6
MTTTFTPIRPGCDLREAFQRAYENRYTWDPDFSGYQGHCFWAQGDRCFKGTFELNAGLKSKVQGIDDEQVLKAVNSQLWEIAIHRVRRDFKTTHGDNTFTAGETDIVGTEVLVGGKGEGDRYRIKDDVVTMVHRHIHGTVVTIFTTETTDTGSGYLSSAYTSQYSDPSTGEPRGGKNSFKDTFIPLTNGGPWVLKERIIECEAGSQTFRFEDLKTL